jgi:hypothetical protein
MVKTVPNGVLTSAIFSTYPQGYVENFEEPRTQLVAIFSGR